MLIKESEPMPDSLIIEHSSPTLAGLKTGSLFSCPPESKEKLTAELSRINRVFVPRGLRIIPVKITDSRILIYVYRPEKLREDFKNSLVRDILAEYGYPVKDSELCVKELIRRMKASESFPHEIGLFLGYPAEDVQGFIRNCAAKPKLVGAWKVYGDAEVAKKKFASYKKCTRLYLAAYAKHRSIDRLAVNA